MKAVTRFLLRTLDEAMRTPGFLPGPPWIFWPQDHMAPTKTSNKTSTSDTNQKYIDPNDRDSWSRGPDLLWLHNTQDKKRKMAKDGLLGDLPYSAKHWPYIDLSEGRVHISRYFP